MCPGFDRLEARRLLATMPPVAQFPLRQFGGVPVGVVEDPGGNAWILLSPGTIAEVSNTGALLAQYQVPSYNALAAAPTGSELGLITDDATDRDLWFYEASSNNMGMLNPATGAIAEYPLLPFASDPGIDQIVAGPDGNIYFTEPKLNEVGLFDITTDRVSQFNMPLADTQPQGITVGTDGNLWFTEGGQNKIASLNPTTHVITNYAFEPPSDVTNDQAEGITAGPNGTIWFVTQQNSTVNEFDISTGEFTKYSPYWPPYPPNPNPPTPDNVDLWSIAAGDDGNIYYTEPLYGWVGVIGDNGANPTRVYSPNPLLGTGSQVTLTDALIAPGVKGTNLFVTSPTAANGAGLVYTIQQGSPANGYGSASLPPVVVTRDANDIISTDGNLYFTDSTDGVGQIGVYNPTTLTYSAYLVPQLPPTTPERNQYPNQLTVDSDGNIWFTETTADIPGDPAYGAIGQFDPKTDSFGQQSYLTAASSDPDGIAWDPTQQQFWITEPSANQLVSYNPATTGSAVAPIVSPTGGVITDPVGILVDQRSGYDYVWIAEQSAKQIIAYDPINESILFTFATKGEPNQLFWGPDGNIWFTESGSGNVDGYVGVLAPASVPGTGGILAEIPVSNAPSYLSAGPTSGPYADTMWFTMAGTDQIGEIDMANDTVVGYATAPDTNANALTLGPDGNLWFTSGSESSPPAWIGAVVLNPNDLGTQVVVTTQPPDVEETFFGGYNYGFGLTVAVENSAGQVDPFVQQGSITITLTAPSGSNGQLIGTATLDVDDGLATFDGLTIEAPFTGTDHAPGQGYTIQATYSLGLNTPTTDPFNVTGPVTQLVVSAEPPASVGAGVAFPITVSGEDANGLIVPTFDDPIQLTIAVNPPGDGVLNGTTIFGALYGSAAFPNLSIDQEGDGYQLQAVDLNSLVSFAPVLTQPFNITAGPAVTLVFDPDGEPPSSASAGQLFATPGQPVLVDAEDQFGQLATSYSGQVTISMANNATGTFDAKSVLTVPVNGGVATFSSLAIDTAGTYNLDAASGTLADGLSSAITINPGNPDQLAFTTPPPTTPITEDVAFPIGLQVVDAYGNPEPTYSGSVTLSLENGGNADADDLGGTTTATTTDGTFSLTGVTIDAPGSTFTLSAATADGLKSPTSADITVVAPQLVVTTQPSGEFTTDSSFEIVVTAETPTGATDTDFTSDVALSIASGPDGGALGGTVSETAISGVATFDAVTVNDPGSYVLQAAGGIATPTRTGTLVAVAPTLVVTTQPSGSITTDSGFEIVVTAETPTGATDTDFTSDVALSIVTGPTGGALGGTLSATPSNGVATFDAVTVNDPGSYVLQAAGGIAAPAQTGTLVALAPQLVVTTQPTTPVTAGNDFTIAVTAETSSGATDTSFTGTVTLGVASGPTGGLLYGTTSEPVQNGVATFDNNVWLQTAGAYSLQAQATGATPGNSRSITVLASPTVASLTILTPPPSTVQAGSGFDLEVGGLDQYGNQTSLTNSVTVSIASNPGDSSLGGTATVSPTDGLVKFTGLMLYVVDTGYQLQAASTGATPVNTGDIAVTPGPADQLAIPPNDPASPLDAGSTFSLTVNVQDQWGNAVPTATGTVTLTQPAALDNAQATISGGVATFNNLAITTVGTYQIKAASGTLTPALSSTFTVVTDATQPAILAWSTNPDGEPPGQVTRNAGFPAIVDVEDQYGNVETDFSGDVTIGFQANPGDASLGGLLTVQAVQGVASFSGLSINVEANGYTLVASSDGVDSPASNQIDVSPIPPTQIAITAGPPGSIDDTETFGLTVQAWTQPNVVDTDFTGPVTLSIFDPADSTALQGTTTVNAVEGTATFSGLSLDQLGDFVLQASVTGLTSVESTGIAVSPGPAAKLVVVDQPTTPVTAGSAFSFVVEAEDALGYQASGFGDLLSATLSPNPDNASLVGSPTASASGGLATFTGLIVKKAGTGYTIQVSDTSSSSDLSTITTAPFNIVAGLPAMVEYSSPPPTSVTAGVPFNLSVGVADTYGNIVSNFSGSVTIALANNSAAGPLGGTLSATVTNGLATFNGLTLDKAATNDTIMASCTTADLQTVTSGAIAVTPAGVSQLAVTTEPPGTLDAGTQFGVAVTAEDPFGNPVAGFTGKVTLSVQGPSGPGVMTGPLTIQATGGVASFPPTLAIDSAGSGWIIHAASPDLTTGSSSPVTVNPLSATQLGVLVQPPATLAPGAPFAFKVAAEDQYGNISPSFSGPITIALSPGSSAGLGGTTQVTTIGGVASFQGLTLTNLTSPVTITATSTALGSITTNPIGPAAQSNPTGSSSSSSGAPVTVTSIQVMVNKKHQVTEILVTFSGALNPADASNTADYRLVLPGKKNSYTAKNAKPIPIGSAVYNAGSDSVALTPGKKLVVKKPIQFTIVGTGPSGLQDASGNLIDGSDTGQAGSNAVAILSKQGKGVGVHSLAERAGTIDVIFEMGALDLSVSWAVRPDSGRKTRSE